MNKSLSKKDLFNSYWSFYFKSFRLYDFTFMLIVIILLQVSIFGGMYLRNEESTSENYFKLFQNRSWLMDIIFFLPLLLALFPALKIFSSYLSWCSEVSFDEESITYNRKCDFSLLKLLNFKKNISYNKIVLIQFSKTEFVGILYIENSNFVTKFTPFKSTVRGLSVYCPLAQDKEELISYLRNKVPDLKNKIYYLTKSVAVYKIDTYNHLI